VAAANLIERCFRLATVRKELDQFVPTEAERQTECGLSAPDFKSRTVSLLLSRIRKGHYVLPRGLNTCEVQKNAYKRVFSYVLSLFAWPVMNTISTLSKPDHYIFMWIRFGSRRRKYARYQKDVIPLHSHPYYAQPQEQTRKIQMQTTLVTFAVRLFLWSNPTRGGR
jgi:hypothetical protein